MKKTLLSLVLLAGFAALRAQDYKSTTSGLSFNLSGLYSTWNSNSNFIGTLDDLEKTGLGFSAKVGYGFSQRFELFLAYGTASFKRKEEWDTYRLSQLELGGRFTFGATLQTFRPFLQVGLASDAFTINPITFDGISLFKLETSGLGLVGGAGTHVFILPNLSATLDLKGSFGNFSDLSLSGNTVDIDALNEKLDFSVFTVHLGLTYFLE